MVACLLRKARWLMVLLLDRTNNLRVLVHIAIRHRHHLKAVNGHSNLDSIRHLHLMGRTRDRVPIGMSAKRMTVRMRSMSSPLPINPLNLESVTTLVVWTNIVIPKKREARLAVWFLMDILLELRT
jgi:hypothetical protein